MNMDSQKAIHAITAIPRASVIEIAGFAVAGWLFGRGIIVEPVIISDAIKLAPGSFLGGAAGLIGTAAVVARNQVIIEKVLYGIGGYPQQREVRELRSWESETKAIETSPGEYERASFDEFGIDESRTILFLERVVRDREFATEHYVDVEPRGRHDYTKFRSAFRNRRMIFKSGVKWKVTERGLRFANGLLGMIDG